MSIDFERDFKPDLLEVAKKLGKTPTIEEYEFHGNFSSNIIYYHGWGGWKEVLGKVGLSLSSRRTRKKVVSDDLHGGMCKSHKNIKAVVNQLCIDCWFKQQASNNLGSVHHWEEIKTLFYAQNSQCVYTGYELIPGVNAWLDHKIPRSRGGSDILENLHWTDKDVNQIKYNRTHEEFLEFCKVVKAYCSKEENYDTGSD